MNENQVTIFTNEEFGNVRTVMVEGEPWFVAKDVATSLGYVNSNKAVNDHCRKAMMTWGNDSLGRRQQFKIIPEGDVYRLVTKSKLPSAERFESWLFDEVVPQIKKYGAYMTEATLEKALTSPDFLIQLATKLKEEQEARKLAEQKSKELSKDNMKLKCENTKLKPKADYADEILQSTGTVTTTQIAKDYGMSAKFMNNVLHSLGIQYKVNDQWLLYSKYADKGYVKSCTHVINHTDGTPESKLYTKWTQKGRMFIYEKLKEEGILPVKYKSESDC